MCLLCVQYKYIYEDFKKEQQHLFHKCEFLSILLNLFFIINV